MTRQTLSKHGGRRAGAGRKPGIKKPTRLSFYVDGPVRDALEELAEGDGVGFSEYLRRVLTRHVKSRQRRR